MDSEGHAKLTDFGLSRYFETRPALAEDEQKKNDTSGAADGNALVTRSYCGTEQYMAPEMLLQRGHTKAVDW